MGKQEMRQGEMIFLNNIMEKLIMIYEYGEVIEGRQLINEKDVLYKLFIILLMLIRKKRKI